MCSSGNRDTVDIYMYMFMVYVFILRGMYVCMYVY